LGHAGAGKGRRERRYIRERERFDLDPLLFKIKGQKYRVMVAIKTPRATLAGLLLLDGGAKAPLENI
jgi:hypothetical protein